MSDSAGSLPDKAGSADDDAAARQAARIATELTEAADLEPPLAGQGRGIRRVTGAIGTARSGVARQTSSVARRTTGAAGRGVKAAAQGTQSAALTARQRAQSAAQAAARRAGDSTRAAQRGMSSAVTWLTGQVVAMGPRITVRDAATLRRQFPGKSDEEIAELLVERAGRASGAVGGATGAWAALPVLPAFPAEVAADTLAVIGIELKLVAELHEITGLPATGSGAERARAYLAAWAYRCNVYAIPGGFAIAAGSPLLRLLRRRLIGRVRRSAFALGPFLTGAAAGALLNRRETRRVGKEVLADLRRHRLGQ